jgi:hypothetical protein
MKWTNRVRTIEIRNTAPGAAYVPVSLWKNCPLLSAYAAIVLYSTDDRHPRACRYCAHFGRYVSGGVWCALHPHVAAAGMGCVHFLREIGADDDRPAPPRWSRRSFRKRYARMARYDSPGRFRTCASMSDTSIAPSAQS